MAWWGDPASASGTSGVADEVEPGTHAVADG